MRTLLWLGLGAAAMYLLDPEQGRRRRAELRERLTQAKRLKHQKPAETPAGASHLGR